MMFVSHDAYMITVCTTICLAWRQEFEPGQNGIIDHVLLSRLGGVVDH